MGDDGTINHWLEVDPARTMGWSRDCEIDCTDARMKKIQSAFDNVIKSFDNVIKSFPLVRNQRIVIQFWAPGKYNGKQQVLLCYGFPYALWHLNGHLSKYRSGCCKYYYTFEDHKGTIPMTITGSPHCITATTGFPEVVIDLSVHQGSPLVDLALECELARLMLLPVFDENQCCGVIEVSMRLPCHLLVIFNELYREIEKVDLSLYPRRKLLTRPLLALTGDFESATREVHNALQVAVQSHDITLGIVRVSYGNSIASPSMKRTLLRKSVDSYFGNPVFKDDLCLELFSSNLYSLKGKGLVARTLETNQPHLCRNIYKLGENKGLVTLLLYIFAKSYAWFVICLRSSHTGESDYVFEFFWPQRHNNHLALMEDLLLTLREHLPSFKYASGAQLGHEALVVDFKSYSSSSSSSSSGSASEKTIKIFPRNKKSQEEPKVTRASYDLHDDGQRELNQYPEDDHLVIVAFYENLTRFFFLPSSATFENVMDTIKQQFRGELNPTGTFKVIYQVHPVKWYPLTDDTCLKNCISSYWASNDTEYITLYVLPVKE